MAIKIIKDKHLVIKEDKEHYLPRKEFEILTLLCSIPGKVFSRTDIFQRVWSENSKSKERTVDVHILNIRKKLGEDAIKTIKGVGYKCLCNESKNQAKTGE